MGTVEVTAEDLVIADGDGVLVLAESVAQPVRTLAEEIRHTEQRQADAIAGGASLRRQLQFDHFRERRRSTPGYMLRQHLLESGGAIEA